MIDWIQTHETAFWWLAIASAVIFLITVIAVPWFLMKIPPDYFAHKQYGPITGQAFARRSVLKIGGNILGGFFILVGVIMLVLPGQGFLAIFVGVMLMNFPGKQKMARWIVSRAPVLRSINWMRRLGGQTPLVLKG